MLVAEPKVLAKQAENEKSPAPPSCIFWVDVVVLNPFYFFVIFACRFVLTFLVD